MATDENESTMTAEPASGPTEPEESASPTQPVADAEPPRPAASTDEPVGVATEPPATGPSESHVGEPMESSSAQPAEASEGGAVDLSVGEPDGGDGDADAAAVSDAADSSAGESDGGDGPDDASADSDGDTPEIVVEGAESAPRKRRRRRRKRRPDGATERAPESRAPEPEESGVASADARFSADPTRDRRERPAFSPGDQVFGKVAQVTDQAILVDIAGKATGLFDLAIWMAGEPAPAPAVVTPAPAAELPAADLVDSAVPAPAAAEPTVVAEPAEALPPAEPSAELVPAAEAAAAEAPAAEAPAAEAPAAEAAAAEAPAAEAPAAEASPTETPAAEIPVPVPIAADRVGREPPKVGDQFIAKVQSCSLRGGLIMLVAEPTTPAEARARLRQAAESSEPIEGWVTSVIKGGIEVDFNGIRAFGPASHVDLRPGADLSVLLGQRLPFVVTQYAKKGRDIVVSRKTMLEHQADQQRGELLAAIEPDTVCEGVVRRVLNWGVFVTLPAHGDVEGVIHMSEASHDRGAKLTDLFRSGQGITVKVLRIDDKGKLWLSRRAVEKNPWDDVAKKYPVGSRHQGRVVRTADFGAFIQLEPGVDGLCHVSDLSYQPLEHPSESVNIGDEIAVVVASLDSHAHKIGLHPAGPEDEQSEARPRLQPYQVVSVVVMQIKEGGLAVRIVGLTGRSQRGFIPAGQTGTPRGTELRKVFPVGKRFDAKVIDIDPRKGESKLSIRALKDDAEREAYRNYRRQVQKEGSFGTLGDLLKKS